MGLFRRNPSGTRLFFTTDLHGSDAAFGKFLNAPDYYGADVLVIGGDITGKMLVPVVRRDGRWEAELFGDVRTAETEAERRDLEATIRRNGFYAWRTTPDEVQELDEDRSKLDEQFAELMRESVGRWVDMAEEKLRSKEVNCFISLGNDDFPQLAQILEASDVVSYPDGQVVRIDDSHEMASCGYANMTPWHCPRDLPEDELAKKIEETLSQVEEMSSCVFNFHAPPYDSDLDIAPALTDDLQPVLIGGQSKMVPVGSVSVREAIEKHQPLLGLHGHVHESRGVATIGRTMCINPGSEYSEGVLRGVLVNLGEDKVTHQFVTG